jgi:glucose-inhibited division protein A
VIVVGAGHAGCEAAIAAANMGAQTMLLTLNLDRIAWQPCNPAVGGPAKSQLVHEIDALGGIIGKMADKCYVQKKTLNLSKVGGTFMPFNVKIKIDGVQDETTNTANCAGPCSVGAESTNRQA